MRDERKVNFERAFLDTAFTLVYGCTVTFEPVRVCRTHLLVQAAAAAIIWATMKEQQQWEYHVPVHAY